MKDFYRYLVIGALLCGLLTPLASGAAPAQEKRLEQQRRDFAAARQALKKGRLKTYRRLSAKLEGYALHGYLDYYYLRKYLKRSSAEDIRRFVAEHADSPISERLHNAWLYSLARRGRWQEFLAAYSGANSARLRCYRARALLKTGQTEAAMAAAEELWLVGKSQPSACDPVFLAWREAGRLSTDLVWQRVRLAMEKRRLSLARYLKRFLPKPEQVWVDRWRQMHRHPAKMLTHTALRKDTPIARDIILHGIRRLARIDAETAHSEWQRLKDGYQFTAAEAAAVQRSIALRAARQRHPQALDWLAAVDDSQADETVQSWRVRAALTRRDWAAVTQWIEQLPSAQRDKDQWQYWRARALENMQRPEEAGAIFTTLAADPGYHGFLAADRLARPYALESSRITHSADELEALSERPGIVRAQELYALDMTVDARREWHFVIDRMNEHELQLAALLAHQWGWHDRAIFTLSRTGNYRDLDLRYPIVFRDQVLENAKQQRIDPAWVYGVLRQESAFMTDARSHAGALGLMQLMPGTGKATARLLKAPLRHTRELLNVDKNIRLGTAHLRHLLDRHKGHQVLATATYNAGPQYVKKWLGNQDSELPADVWIEIIPLTETRRYLRSVLASTLIFEHRLRGKVTPLPQRMPPVVPKPS